MLHFPHSDQRGQALLVVVLVMVVSLTVGLSLALRTVTNLRISTEEENSQRAFSAAEAGIERVLRTGVGIANERQLDNNASIKSVNVTEIKGTELLLNAGNPLSKDDGADIWLVSHRSDNTIDYSAAWNGNLTLHWGITTGDCNNAAMQAIVLSGTSVAAAKTTKYAIDPCAARRAVNNFCPKGGAGCPTLTSPGDSVAGQAFSYKTTLSISNGYLVRVVPLYANTTAAVVASATLPIQGKRLDSVGASGDAVRKVTFFQGYPRLSSEFFQYAIFSPK